MPNRNRHRVALRPWPSGVERSMVSGSWSIAWTCPWVVMWDGMPIARFETSEAAQAYADERDADKDWRAARRHAHRQRADFTVVLNDSPAHRIEGR